jgi:arylsulfatase
MKRMSLAMGAVLIPIALGFASSAFAQQAAKPNILVIFGDDIGVSNVSAYIPSD